ncbi:MAG: hypothetical protein ACK4ME_10645 [Fimbriimonadales bacterium]
MIANGWQAEAGSCGGGYAKFRQPGRIENPIYPIQCDARRGNSGHRLRLRQLTA